MSHKFSASEATEAFWAKVDRTSQEGCWPWIASTFATTGRGQVAWRGRRTVAYRVAWEIVNGEIPAGLFVCHKCDNPICVRPGHLFLGTARDNSHDMLSKKRGVAPPVHSGVQHHNAYVPDEEVCASRQSFADGIETSTQIAARLGCAQSTVMSWLHGKTRLAAGGPVKLRTDVAA